MKCPFCSNESNKVINSRTTNRSFAHWRRRKCLVCSNVFTTYEKIDLSYLIVVKSDGSKERFKEAKLYSGIYASTISSKTRNRESVVSNIVEKTNQQIIKLKTKEVSSVVIKECVLKILKEEDIRAYWRFRAYGDKESFLRKISKDVL